MEQSMNYDEFAENYAQTRWAVPWVLQPLLGEVQSLPENSTLVEIGCGTGNYITAISKELPHHIYKGFDLSEEMLKVARSRSSEIEFLSGNAEVRFPYPSGHCELAFAVDVIHYIECLDVFFREGARILKPGRSLLIITDSEANIRNRSLTQYFPETFQIELERYPSLEVLHRKAERAGLKLIGTETAEGAIELDEGFISKLEEKCSSAMRLISDQAYREGIARVRQARDQGEEWLSCYTVIKYKQH